MINETSPSGSHQIDLPMRAQAHNANHAPISATAAPIDATIVTTPPRAVARLEQELDGEARILARR